MATTTPSADTYPIFHLEITDQHAIVLPPELRERLGVEASDVLAFSVAAGQGFVYRVPKAKAADPVVYEKIPELKGLLSDYFTDWDDINRFVQDERRGREDPDDQGP